MGAQIRPVTGSERGGIGGRKAIKEQRTAHSFQAFAHRQAPHRQADQSAGTRPHPRVKINANAARENENVSTVPLRSMIYYR